MQQPFLIGITGGSGSGKTSFIRKLREGFSDEELTVISQDDYYRPRELQQKDENGIINFDLPKAIDRKAFIRDVKKLMDGKKVRRKEYTFNNEKANPKYLIFKPAKIIVVEGLFVFHYKKMRAIMDLTVFLSAMENLKLIRRIKRDRLERNYPLEDVLYRYENHVLPAFLKYIEPYVDSADIVVNNNKDFIMGLTVLKGFMRDYLNQLAP